MLSSRSSSGEKKKTGLGPLFYLCAGIAAGLLVLVIVGFFRSSDHKEETPRVVGATHWVITGKEVHGYVPLSNGQIGEIS